ncbi:SDR family oxidoreductase [Sphingobium sp. WCS2017Hpa-17]|uniref:SDR family NAD(P)-dependent oxidoreductase n=1 Tax=Sphingobium sp. WCS2017Hpa-17 TaxID=3073638 RepID=UPI00288925A9|nr:SDR family oxidoreductase [Sphingobium sp. WCS2017Hpa-17]
MLAPRLGLPATAVIVTGGASGIGLATAHALAAVGRRVAIWDVDKEGGITAAAHIRETWGVPALAQEIDLLDLMSIGPAADTTRATLGPIGGLVHSAGTAQPTGLDGLTEAAWTRGIDLHVRALAFTAKALRSEMRMAGGSAIVAVASINAHLGNGLIPIYTAAKGAILSLVRALADELAADGIRVNSVSPGMIDTPMLASDRDAMAERFGKRILLGRLGQADEVARTIRFLLSEEASYVTGAELVVDGGNICSQR